MCKGYSKTKGEQVKTWLITDTHFGHKNVITWCNRPANFVEKVERGLEDITAYENPTKSKEIG